MSFEIISRLPKVEVITRPRLVKAFNASRGLPGTSGANGLLEGVGFSLTPLSLVFTSPTYICDVTPSEVDLIMEVSEPHLFLNDTLFAYFINNGNSVIRIPPRRSVMTFFKSGILTTRLL